jgi:hypothetical protein
LWLYLDLLASTRLIDERLMPVAEGIAISDEQLAHRLDLTMATIGRWRKLLERLGYVRTQLVRPRYRKMWLPNLHAGSRQQTLMETPVNAAVN